MHLFVVVVLKRMDEWLRERQQNIWHQVDVHSRRRRRHPANGNPYTRTELEQNTPTNHDFNQVSSHRRRRHHRRRPPQASRTFRQTNTSSKMKSVSPLLPSVKRHLALSTDLIPTLLQTLQIIDVVYDFPGVVGVLPGVSPPQHHGKVLLGPVENPHPGQEAARLAEVVVGLGHL